MKRLNRWNLFIAGVVLLAIAVVVRARVLVDLSFKHPIDVAIVADPSSDYSVVRSYETYFVDNGIPYAIVSVRDFLLLSSKTAVKNFPVVLFPDTVDQRLPAQMRDAAEAYTRAGGHAIIVSDAGTKRADGTYLRLPLFQELLGVAYEQYFMKRASAYSSGPVRFLTQQSLQTWNVPYGKHDKQNQLTTYGYGIETFPLSVARRIAADTGIEAATANDGVVISRRHVGQGQAVFVGLPLGYLKSRSDGFAMQAVLESLVQGAQIPHLVPSPQGIGRVIFDFHIDSSIEFRGVANLLAKHLLRTDVPVEFDITAGPDSRKVGDGLGLDACGRGRPVVRRLMRYGRIGSHGGWAHDKFAHDVEARRLSPSAMKELIAKNNRCLSSITRYPITSYAAPAGAHPQPVMTDALASLGMNSYYYTGDTGGAAERVIANGNLIDPSVIAFPIMPLRDNASIGEFAKNHISPAEVDHWFADTMDYTMRERTMQLLYSHSYDFLNPRYAPAFRHWEQSVAAAIRAHRVSAGDMASSATFLQRFIQTNASFSRARGALEVTLDNPQGLRDIAFAVPREDRPEQPLDHLRSSGGDSTFRYYYVNSDDHHIEATFAAP